MSGTAAEREQVREYYGKVLRSNADLKSSACCPADAFPEHLKRIFAGGACR